MVRVSVYSKELLFITWADEALPLVGKPAPACETHFSPQLRGWARCLLPVHIHDQCLDHSLGWESMHLANNYFLT